MILSTDLLTKYLCFRILVTEISKIFTFQVCEYLLSKFAKKFDS